MKTRVLLFLSLNAIFICCQRESKIVGIWERKGDSFSGMKIEVKKTGEIVNGIIIYSPDTAQRGGFFKNDIKWKIIKKIDGNNYEFEDLMKFTDNFGKIMSFRYDLARLIISKDTIKIIMYTKGEEIMGTEQIWIKTK